MASEAAGAPDAAGNQRDSWAPDDVFNAILRYSVVPTFDLILEGIDGVLLVRRRISPYARLWALPGLRMHKGETLYECLSRIAHDEVGVQIDPYKGRFVNQAVARFQTHQKRQDLSTCYAFNLEIDRVVLNAEHLSSWMFVRDLENIPDAIGGLYSDHLNRYFQTRGEE